MIVTDTQISEWFTQYMWVLMRVSALISMAPIFSMQNVPVKIKASFAILLTAVIAPQVEIDHSIAPFSAMGFLMIIQQVLIGLAIGFAMRMIFSLFVFGGQIIGQSMGLGFASLIDPQNGIQVPVMSQLYQLIAMLIFLSIDGHLWVVKLLTESFYILPVSNEGILRQGYLSLSQLGGWIIMAGLLMALPCAIALLLMNVAFGVMTRASPQLNVFSIGFAISLLFGLVLVFATLAQIENHVVHAMEHLSTIIYSFIDRG